MTAGSAIFRVAGGSRVDPNLSLSFRYGGKTYRGLAGDTLASALLANGVRTIGRSFKYHRPRGLIAAGVEEPNALVQLGAGDRSIPNLRATEIELSEGLVAAPVNCWPSANFDIGGLNNVLSRFLSAGFYYKTFMWPDWHLYEGFIRRAAGLGTVPNAPDPARYETRYAHCDILVVGSGAAGLAAARTAAASGARVMLVEQDVELGGRLRWDTGEVDGEPSSAWTDNCVAELTASPEVTILTRTSAVGYFDHNELALVQRLPGGALPGDTGFRFWQVRAARVILATGAIERPLVFSGNDRPGIMLASAVRQYLSRYGVACGSQAVIFTNNDDAYETAFRLAAAGTRVSAVVDARNIPDAIAGRLRELGIAAFANSHICDTRGYRALSAVQLRKSNGRKRWLRCDLLAMSGGFNPTVHLFCQAGGKLRFDDTLACFVPDQVAQALAVAGSAEGRFVLSDKLASGHAAASAALTAIGLPSDMHAPTAPRADNHPILPLWVVPGGANKAFVDYQNDVAVGDIELAQRESFVSVEHLKRYTTLGMAPDQGKTSNVNALAIMAGLTGQSIGETGTTRYRFPYTPAPLGCFRGLATGALFRPLRRLPAHDRHVALGARFEDFGGWDRPASYPLPGETVLQSEQREAAIVRQGAGLFDGSPLGKIEVKGPDAAQFLDLIYANTMSSLKVGRCRYGLMLNEMGVVIDDGITARLAHDHFLVGTTGGGADRITEWLEEWHQCEWPHLQLIIAPVTTAWGVLTLSGPKARDVLRRVGTDFSLEAADFVHMAFRHGTVAGMPARVMRVSFTGEVSFEINVPSRRTGELWDTLMQAGAAFGIAPVGVDGWMILRTEKGFLHVGVDTDGTTSALDIGWSHILKKQSDFIGKRSLLRAHDQSPERLQLVGFRALDGAAALPVGSHLIPSTGTGSEGFVTSSAYSAPLGCGVAMGMLRRGLARKGEQVLVESEAGQRRAEVVDMAAYDPKGERLNG